MGQSIFYSNQSADRNTQEHYKKQTQELRPEDQHQIHYVYHNPHIYQYSHGEWYFPEFGIFEDQNSLIDLTNSRRTEVATSSNTHNLEGQSEGKKTVKKSQLRKRRNSKIVKSIKEIDALEDANSIYKVQLQGGQIELLCDVQMKRRYPQEFIQFLLKRNNQ